MRQVGVIAAAGIVALDTMVDRLVEDHNRAKAIGKGKEGLSTTIIKILH
jgi:threonine aldolase